MIQTSPTRNKCYSELRLIPTFEERYKYLRIKGQVGETTFGFDRYINQMFYSSVEWKRIRDLVIIRDKGCDLGIPDREIFRSIQVHHMNPISIEDIETFSRELMDPEFLICVSLNTHNAIHYGDENHLAKGLIERTKNDTCPWRR